MAFPNNVQTTIDGLEACVYKDCKTCPYNGEDHCMKTLKLDALTWLQILDGIYNKALEWQKDE